MLTLRYNEPVFILMLRGRVGCLLCFFPVPYMYHIPADLIILDLIIRIILAEEDRLQSSPYVVFSIPLLSSPS